MGLNRVVRWSGSGRGGAPFRGFMEIRRQGSKRRSSRCMLVHIIDAKVMQKVMTILPIVALFRTAKSDEARLETTLKAV